MLLNRTHGNRLGKVDIGFSGFKVFESSMIHTLTVEVNLESSWFLYHIELDYKKKGKVVAGGAWRGCQETVFFNPDGLRAAKVGRGG